MRQSRTSNPITPRSASLTALFRHIVSAADRSADDISTWETIREKVLCFIRDKVFPLKGELLKPLDEMERHLTNMIKQRVIESCGVRVVKGDIKPVRGGELCDAGAHLPVPHHPDALDLYHVSALVSFTTTDQTYSTDQKGTDNNKRN
ncbi:unnamed protein product [Fraxinus pennsylvanica]|uniref:Uncharacterized protein n=1 Tax=Fraxinus pennsylvanica TaxID=56036 RepID=A0AAD2DP37_9LAMI|nr:unnamed protein product [Fraxinus pennsylvanica]